MSPDRFKLIKRIFLDAIERPEAERLRYVDERSEGDADLQREVLELVRHHEGRDSAPRTGASITSPHSDGPSSATPRADAGPIHANAGEELVSQPTRILGSQESLSMQASMAAKPRATVLDATPPRPASAAVGAGGSGASRSALSIDRGRFPPGAMVADRYRIIDCLGRGGMGEVYRADDLKLGEQVALKFLPHELSGNPTWKERFLQEVRTARNVSHPNICRVYDVGEHVSPVESERSPTGSRTQVMGGNELFISMEYIDGETLNSLASRIGRLPPRKAEQLAQQLCAGLAAIHDQGLLHRDLKPANIMIDHKGQLRVADFGLAVPGEIKGFQAAAGTPGYVAPEALNGVESTVRSDIYQLGLVLHELFTGHPAYRSVEGQDLLKVQRTSDPAPPSTVVADIKPQVEQAILKCLERDPASRPVSARAVARLLPGADPLAAALEAGQTPSPTQVAMSGRRGRVRPIVAVGVFALFVVLLLTGLRLTQTRSVINMASLDKSPIVLADKAREILAGIGYPIEGGSEAYALDLYDELLWEIERFDESTTRWDKLKRERPAAIDFWYRWSPAHMGTQSPVGRVTMLDPPFAVPGMIQVRLTPRGKLREIAVVDPATYWPLPDDTRASSALEVGPVKPPVNFGALFIAAGLDPAKFTSVPPTRIPQVFAEERAAWDGVYPESPDIAIRVEIAASNGRVVAFRTVEKKYPYAQRAFIVPPLQAYQRYAKAASQVLLFITVIGGALFAWRNIKSKRGDLGGAWRAGSGVAVLTFLAMLLTADSLRSGLDPLGNIGWMISRALASGALVLLLYLGVEPYVRRVWPESIISWTRLIQGRFTDPLVGLSVLVGAALGAAALVVIMLSRSLPGALGLPPARPYVDDVSGAVALNGISNVLGHIGNCMLRGLDVAMIMLVTCVLIKFVVRKTWIALAIFVTLQTLLWVSASPVLNTLPQLDARFWTWPPSAWALIAGHVTAMALLLTLAMAVLVRFGVLALMVAGFVFTLLASTPITFDLSRWFAGTGLMVLTGVAAVAVGGAAAAVLGRSKAAAA